MGKIWKNFIWNCSNFCLVWIFNCLSCVCCSELDGYHQHTVLKLWGWMASKHMVVCHWMFCHRFIIMSCSKDRIFYLLPYICWLCNLSWNFSDHCVLLLIRIQKWICKQKRNCSPEQKHLFKFCWDCNILIRRNWDHYPYHGWDLRQKVFLKTLLYCH